MAANLPIWKRETGQEWLRNVPSQSLQHALKDLEKLYWHIDNGGIHLNIAQDEWANINIVFSTQYHGYPHVSSVLNIGPAKIQSANKMNVITHQEMLREIGLAFIRAADKVA